MVMSKKNRKPGRAQKSVFTLLVVLWGANGWGWFSDDGEAARGPALLRSPAGVRAQGLGGAYVALSDDVSAVQWNPAGLQQLPTQEAAMRGGRGMVDQRRQSVGYVRPVWVRHDRRTWGIEVDVQTDESLDIYEEEIQVGVARPYQGVLTFAWAQPLWGLNSGASVKAIQQRVYEQSGQTFALDLALQGRLGERGRWGTTVSNLGPPMKMGNEKLYLPTEVRVGGAYRFLPGKWGTGTGTVQLDVPAAELPVARVGGEWGGLFARDWRGAFRAGYSTFSSGRWVVGMGVSRGEVGVQYAFCPGGELEDEHQIELSFRFGGPLKQETDRAAKIEKARALLADRKLIQAKTVIDDLMLISPNHWEVNRMESTARKLHEDSVDPETLFNFGYQSYETGNFIKAVDYFEKLMALKPDHAEGARWLARAREESFREKRKKVQDDLRVSQEKEKRELLRQAQVLMDSKEWERALDVWVRLREWGEKENVSINLPRCQEELYAKAQKALDSGDEESALRLFQAVNRGGTFRDADSKLLVLEEGIKKKKILAGKEKHQQGKKAYAEGHLEMARSLFEEALALISDDKSLRQALDRVREEIKIAGEPPR